MPNDHIHTKAAMLTPAKCVNATDSAENPSYSRDPKRGGDGRKSARGTPGNVFPQGPAGHWINAPMRPARRDRCGAIGAARPV
ncbi:hypothetical protein GCM10011574_14050 [Microbispora bryophytorum]|uniref:Uncharacterized protein n=1 Tax=Microbispora bryophytorum TaxID=1460882 RepID=A0A8H9GVI3_9ACTN|nr:hypothetical protein GCM10011574_14050 [Microbispora bryophytorum]